MDSARIRELDRAADLVTETIYHVIQSGDERIASSAVPRLDDVRKLITDAVVSPREFIEAVSIFDHDVIDLDEMANRKHR